MKIELLSSVAIVLTALFFVMPHLPKWVLFATDNIVVRVILLVSLVSVANKNLPLGLLYFLVLANLFIERNGQKVKQLTSRLISNMDGKEDPAIENIRTPPTAPVQPVFQNPSERLIPFMPADETGDNQFNPVGESIDQKVVLPTETVDGSDKAIKQLFGWVDPTLVQS